MLLTEGHEFLKSETFDAWSLDKDPKLEPERVHDSWARQSCDSKLSNNWIKLLSCSQLLHGNLYDPYWLTDCIMAIWMRRYLHLACFAAVLSFSVAGDCDYTKPEGSSFPNCMYSHLSTLGEEEQRRPGSTRRMAPQNYTRARFIGLG